LLALFSFSIFAFSLFKAQIYIYFILNFLGISSNVNRSIDSTGQKARRGLLTIRNNDDGSKVTLIVRRVWIETSGMTNRTETVIAGPFVSRFCFYFLSFFLVDTSISINFKRIDGAMDAHTTWRKTLITFIRSVRFHCNKSSLPLHLNIFFFLRNQRF